MGMVMQTGLTSTIFLSVSLLLISFPPRSSPTVRSLRLSSSMVFNSPLRRGWLVHLDESFKMLHTVLDWLSLANPCRHIHYIHAIWCDHKAKTRVFVTSPFRFCISLVSPSIPELKQ